MLQVAKASQNHVPTIEDVLNVGCVAYNILSHIKLFKLLRRTSKAFRHAVDSTIITRFSNDDRGGSDPNLNELLKMPWDLQIIEYDFSLRDLRDDYRPPFDSISRHFDKWKNLRELTIVGPDYCDIELLGSCVMGSLTSLHLLGPYFNANSAEQLLTAPWWARIRKLEIDVSNHHLTSFQRAHANEFFRKLPPLLVGLEEIKVFQHAGEGFGTSLFNSAGFQNLRSIDYSSLMNDDDAAAFSQLQLPNLEHLSVFMLNKENTCEDICKCNAMLKSLKVYHVSTLDIKLLAEATWANTLTSLNTVGVTSLHLSMEGIFEFRALKELTILWYYDTQHGEDSLRNLGKARLPELTYLSLVEDGEADFNGLNQTQFQCDVSFLIDAPWCCQLQVLRFDLGYDEHVYGELAELLRHGSFDALSDFTVRTSGMEEVTLPYLLDAGRGRFRSLQSLAIYNHAGDISWDGTEHWNATILNAWTEQPPHT